MSDTPIGDMLMAIEPETKQLNDWERGFFTDQWDRYEKYGEGIFMSPKQIAILRKMYEKVTGDVEAPPIDAYEEDDDDKD